MILMIFTSLKIVNSECNERCLKCNTNQFCQLCDSLQNFYLNQNACLEKNIENCVMIDIHGKCLGCVKDHYVDEENGKCVQLTNNFLIANCEFYTNQFQCQLCSKDFYLNDKNRCLAVENKIANCLYNRSIDTCNQCERGYIKSLYLKQCTQINQEDNCLMYSHIFCNECSTNTIKDVQYNESRFVSSFTTETLRPMIKEKLNTDFEFKNKQCRMIETLNCSILKNYKECQNCNEGYYLDNGKCVKNPKPVIPHCAEYLNYDQCKICENQYHLDQNYKCQQNSIIENCKNYKRDSFETQCEECIDDYYKNSSTSCEQRTQNLNDIDNCQTLSIDEDKCTQCVNNYQLTQDNQKCLREIENCKEYQPSDNSTIELKCEICEDFNYPSQNRKTCIKGQITNCLGYTLPSSDIANPKCKTCENQYYLLDSTATATNQGIEQTSSACSQHKSIEQCEQYSQLEKNQCFMCEKQFLPFKIESFCESFSGTIQNCKIYIDSNSCQTCEDGYYKDGTSCLQIAVERNCLQVNPLQNQKCQKCASNYILTDNGSCLIMPNYLAENCHSNNLSSGIIELENAQCEYCQEDSISFDYKDKYVCMNHYWINSLSSNSQNTSIIANCAQMEITQDSNGEIITCNQCLPGYFAHKDSKSCVSACEPTEHIRLISFSTVNNKFFIDQDKSMKCFENEVTDEYCEIKVYTNQKTGSSELKCGKCKSTAFTEISTTFLSDSSIPIKDFDKSLNDGFPSSPVHFFPEIINCVKDESVQYINSSKVNNCQYYQKLGTKHGCYRCQDGYQGKVEKYSEGNVDYYYISECNDSLCQKQFIPGLPMELNKINSCYLCLGNQIPFLFVDAGESYVEDYKLFTLDSSANLANETHTFECHNPTELATLKGVTDLSMNKDCALGLYNINSNHGNSAASASQIVPNLNQLKMICLACKPGFKNTNSKNDSNVFFKFLVSSCTQIENCQSSQWFNRCSVCKTGYSFVQVQDSDSNDLSIDYQKCEQFNEDPLCYVISIDESQVKECLICKKGSQLNHDNVCEEIKSPKCEESSTLVKLTQTNNNNYDLNTLMYLHPKGQGCAKCQGNMVAIKLNNNMTLSKNVCVSSNYVSQKTTSKYISNCANYNNSSLNLRCSQCKSGFVLKDDLTECLSIKNLQYCEIAKDSETCKKCVFTHIAVNKKCVLKNIENCLTYKDDFTQVVQKCQICQAGYYLSQEKCVKGNIQNCQQMGNSKDTCNICEDKYIKVQDINGKDYCYPDLEDLKCLRLDTDKFQNQIYKCLECIPGENLFMNNLATVDQFAKCLPFTPIENCEELEQGNKFDNSSYKCKNCKPDFYNDNGYCVKRESQIENCLEKSVSQDSCQNCNKNYFYDNSTNQCLEEPKGIQGCRIYSKSDVCLACEKDKYLDDKICIEVPNKIENCEFYSDLSSCSQCADGYLNVNNICVKTTAQNCKTYKSPSECATCPDQKGLQTEGANVNCTSNSDINCISFSSNAPFQCYACTREHAVQNGECTKVVTKINNCEFYSDMQSCSKCSKGYILSLDKKSCFQNTHTENDENCLDLQQLSTPECVICKSNHILNQDSKCVPCKAENCQYCISEESDLCLVCKSKYKMNKDQKCTIQNNLPVNQPNNDNTTPVEETKFGFLRVFLMLLMII